MTIQVLANWFNFVGTAIVLLLSLAVVRHHPRPYFGRWLNAYGSGTTLVGLELVASYVGRRPVLDQAEVICCVTGTWWFLQTGMHLRGKQLPSWLYGLAVLIGLLVVNALRLHGWPFALAAAPVLVVFSLAHCYLGYVFLTMPAPNGVSVPSMRWQGWPQIAIGLWLFTFPALEHSTYFWVGFLVSGILNILMGTGMLVYLLEEAAAQRNADLVRAAEHKRMFLSIVSHELRTPLASIMGFHELIEDDGANLTQQQREFLRQMMQSEVQLASLIDSLLDTFQIESGTLRVQMEAVDVAEAVLEALGPLQAIVGNKSLELDVTIPTDLPQVQGDSQRIVQVVNNLVANAAKFTEPGGRLAVRVTRGGDFVRVEVQDNGVGIPPDQLPHVFESFYQGDGSLTRRYGGSGLGLTIVRELVTRMGGHVGVESTPGQGSCFWFTLALVEGKPAAPTTPLELPAP